MVVGSNQKQKNGFGSERRVYNNFKELLRIRDLTHHSKQMQTICKQHTIYCKLKLPNPGPAMMMDGLVVDADYPPPMAVWGPRERGWLGKQRVKDEHVSPKPADTSNVLSPTECADEEMTPTDRVKEENEETTESPSSHAKRRVQDYLRTDDKDEKKAKVVPSHDDDDGEGDGAKQELSREEVLEMLKMPGSPPVKEDVKEDEKESEKENEMEEVKDEAPEASVGETSQPSRPGADAEAVAARLKKLRAAKDRREKKRQRKRAQEGKEALRQQKAARSN